MADVVKLPGAMPAQTRRRYTTRLPREQRREQLLDVALRLIAERGFRGLSMEAVARDAEIAKTVVYDLFANQGELLTALLEREQKRVLETIVAALPTLPLDGDPAEILAASVRSVLEAVRANPDTWRLMLLPADGHPPAVRNEVNRHRERLARQVEPMAEWGTERLGLGRLDPELVAHLLIAGAEDAIRLTLTHPRRFPPERLAGFSVDLLRAAAK